MKTLLTAAALAATAMAGALGTLGTASAAPVTLTFEGATRAGTITSVAPGEIVDTQDGFTVTASGSAGSLAVAGDVRNTTGSNFVAATAPPGEPNWRGFAISADDDGAFDLTSFQLAGYSDRSFSFRIDYELASGAMASTDIFSFATDDATVVPLQTLTVNLTGIVRAAFVAVMDGRGDGSSYVAFDNVVLNGTPPSAVPVPAAALLFPLGLGCLAAARRRRG